MSVGLPKAMKLAILPLGMASVMLCSRLWKVCIENIYSLGII